MLIAAIKKVDRMLTHNLCICATARQRVRDQVYHGPPSLYSILGI